MNKKTTDIRKIWLVVFPTYQYNENVKQLATKAGIKIIDAKHSHLIAEEFVEPDPSKLTKKSSKAKAPAKVDK